jgi:hypothetical protein
MQALCAWLAGMVVLGALGACAQRSAPPVETGPVATSAIQGATPVGTFEGHLDPTAAVGGGANASSALSPNEVARVFGTVAQASQLRVTANASPPGATGADVSSVSVVAQDSGGLLKSLDAPGKQSLGDAILTAAATAWPNASVSLLITDPAGAGGTIIGTRPKGGPNSVIAS